MGKTRRRNPEYEKLRGKIYRLRTIRTLNGIVKKKSSEIPQDRIKEYKMKLRKISSGDPMDPNFRRIRYIRYADDWIVGITGPKKLTQEIQNKIQEFLKTDLKLTLSPEKTKITKLSKGKVSFLGFYLESGGKSENSSNKIEKKRRTVG